MPRTKAAALSIVHLKKPGVALKACVYLGNCPTVHQAAIVSNMFRFNSIQLPMNKLELLPSQPLYTPLYRDCV